MKTFTKIWLGIALAALGFGIILIIIVIVSGGSVIMDLPASNYHQNLTGYEVTDVDMNIEYAKVKIVRGDSFSINAENVPENYIESHVENGTWIINQNRDSVFNIFGARVHLDGLRYWRWWRYDNPEITITIPADFTADSFKLDVGAGDVMIKEIIASKADFTASAGRLVIEHASISDEANYDVGAGSIEIKELQANNVSIDCGVGRIFIEGTITGNNDITCGVGSVKLKLEGKEEDYSYEIESGVGSIKIGNRHYSGISNEKITNNGTAGVIKLDCDVGNITVDFQ